ncbi:hypothetical protein [Dyadobacter sandarakinus]|uniref:DUF2029 domain-containing protein n=1 Tax=Dyadobacter sandarakinus TaxID=2747268 RepID=A0ABX7IDC1_9BACT|nr:hypothetical protein [Dyadobacter sandarakinus]QRR02901.1 hypothetical protein HWI92_19295 [Dyadobacter sandarakinus]
MSIVVAKTAISLLSVLLVIIFLARQNAIVHYLDNKPPGRVLFTGWLLLRLVPFLFIYIAAGIEPTSDVNGFWDEASKASQGMVVYRDFWSPYSPLYPYLLAIGVKFWYSPKMVVLVMVIMDGIALFLSSRFFRPFQPKGEVLFKSLLYLLLPGSLVLCVVAAQEDVWMWLFVILPYLVRERTLRVAWYAVLLALGLLITKAIFVLILVPLFLVEKQKLRMIIPMALVGIIALAILFLLVGWEFTQPLGEAQTLRAPNIPSVINPWFFNAIGVGEKFWNWVGLLISVGMACVAAWRLRHADFRIMLSRVWVILYATMMIVQQSAYSNYIFIFLIPLVLHIINWKNRTEVGLLLIYNVLCVVQPSFWWRLGMPCYLAPADLFSSWQLAVDYAMQILIVLLTIYFIWLAFPTQKTLKRITVRA